VWHGGIKQFFKIAPKSGVFVQTKETAFETEGEILNSESVE
jgi:hypothetical protein